MNPKWRILIMRLIQMVMLALLYACVGTQQVVLPVFSPLPNEVDKIKTVVVKDSVQFVSFPHYINQLTGKAFIDVLHDIDPNKVNAVVITIDSLGGEVPIGSEMARAIETLPLPTICLVQNEAASMAFYNLQMCTLRIMTVDSRLLIHGPKQKQLAEFSGTKNDYQKIANELNGIEQSLADEFCTRLTVNRATILKNIDGKDWWVGPEESNSIGAIDIIVKDAAAEHRFAMLIASIYSRKPSTHLVQPLMKR